MNKNDIKGLTNGSGFDTIMAKEERKVFKMMNMKINNLPEKATKFQYIVCHVVDGAVWFYGAWDGAHEADARRQAREIGGFVVENAD